MKCLSLWQPYATLMATGAKQVETRGWAMHHRGPLLIHAAKKWDADLAFTAAGQPFRAALERAGVVFEATEASAKVGWGMPFGAIVGMVDVVDCFKTDDVGSHSEVKVFDPGVPQWRQLRIDRTERAFGDYSPGRFAILCAYAVRFAKPIPFRGAQRLFEVPDEALAAAIKGAA